MFNTAGLGSLVPIQQLYLPLFTMSRARHRVVDARGTNIPQESRGKAQELVEAIAESNSRFFSAVPTSQDPTSQDPSASIVDGALQIINYFFYNKSDTKQRKTNLVVFSVYILLFEPSACILNILPLNVATDQFVLFSPSVFFQIFNHFFVHKHFGSRAVSFRFTSNFVRPSSSPMSSKNDCSKSVSHSQLCLMFSFSIFEK